MPDCRHRDVVLVVEDDDDFRESLAYLLALRGYEVAEASNGREALERLGADPTPCLILLDLMMPVMDGWTLRDALLRDERLARVPVVLLSGADDVAAEARALRAASYLVKPVDSRVALRVVAEHC